MPVTKTTYESAPRSARVHAMRAEIARRWERRTETIALRYASEEQYAAATYRSALHKLAETNPEVLDATLDAMNF